MAPFGGLFHLYEFLPGMFLPCENNSLDRCATSSLAAVEYAFRAALGALLDQLTIHKRHVSVPQLSAEGRYEIRGNQERDVVTQQGCDDIPMAKRA